MTCNQSERALRVRGRCAGFLALALAAVCLPQAAEANGLYENRSWQFDTSADKANKAFVTDMIERKKGGYYDAFQVNHTHNTYIDEQYNCSVSPNAVGNSSASAMESVTSSPTVSPGSNTSASSTGNEAANSNSGKAPVLNNDQNNSGNQYANVSDLTATAGPVNASGGKTSQVLNNSQTNTGNQHASVTDSTGCVFEGGGKGHGQGQAAAN